MTYLRHEGWVSKSVHQNDVIKSCQLRYLKFHTLRGSLWTHSTVVPKSSVRWGGSLKCETAGSVSYRFYSGLKVCSIQRFTSTHNSVSDNTPTENNQLLPSTMLYGLDPDLPHSSPNQTSSQTSPSHCWINHPLLLSSRIVNKETPNKNVLKGTILFN